MRDILFIVLIICFLSPVVNGQWDLLNSGFKGRLNSIDFVDHQTGWIAGDAGTLLLTLDGGETWIDIFSDEDLHFRQIDFINKNDGWAIAWDGNSDQNVMMHTSDGGKTWQVQKQEKEIYFSELQVVDDHIVILGSDFLLWKSPDSGKTWNEILSAENNMYFSSVRFLDEQTGIVTGTFDNNITQQAIIMRTFDGGTEWEKIIVPEFRGIYDFQFTSGDGFFIASDDTGRAYFLQTQDTCKSWSQINTDDHSVESFFLLSNSIIFAALRDSLFNTSLKRSIDGGKNWTEVVSLTNWRLQKIYFHDETKGILIFGLGGRGWRSQLILTKLWDQDKWLTRKYAYNFEDVHFFDPDNGFAYGGYFIFHGPEGGDLFATADGGKTWSLSYSLPGYIRTCSFPSRSTGYALIMNWMSSIYKTTDGGSSWQLAYYNSVDSTGFDINMNDIFFVTDEVGYGAGRFWTGDSAGACILKTSDGGKQWDFLWTHRDETDIYYELRTLYLIEDKIWAVGERGFMVTSSEAGSFRIIPAKTDMPLNNIFFSDTRHGWVSGGYWSDQEARPVMLKTTDGGLNWAIDRMLPYLINEIIFRDSLQGWAAAYDSSYQGAILTTKNGGESWIPQVEHLPAPLNGLHFIGDYGWAVGEQGLVLKTENGGASWIGARNEVSYPVMFRLQQNYPNPFNHSTVISWQLAISSHVELSVYNLLGEKVATLLSEKQTAGHHQVEWNAKGYASGLYYYRLVTGGGFIQTRKLLLLK